MGEIPRHAFVPEPLVRLVPSPLDDHQQPRGPRPRSGTRLRLALRGALI